MISTHRPILRVTLTQVGIPSKQLEEFFRFTVGGVLLKYLKKVGLRRYNLSVLYEISYDYGLREGVL